MPTLPNSPRPPRSPFFFMGALLLALGVVLYLFLRPQLPAADPFATAMNTGKNYLDQGESAKAIDSFKQAVLLEPTHPDAHLNLANSYLRAGQPDLALQHARETLALDPNSAAAFYVEGCAHLRRGAHEDANKAFQQSLSIDPTVAAAHFQLGLAQQQLKQYEEAAASFQTTLEIEPEHPAAHYNLSQVWVRLGQTDPASQELELHRAILAKLKNPPSDPSAFEQCKHTQARAPFELEQPDPAGISVAFVDATAQAFAAPLDASQLAGPIAAIDVGRDGVYDLFVREGPANFRLLRNQSGSFQPQGEPLPALAGATYYRCLVGDLQNDRAEDLIVLGSMGSHVFKLATNGTVTDSSVFSRINDLAAVDGALVDLDFTGKLDLITTTTTGQLRFFRNLGNLMFRDITATSGIPASVTAARQNLIEDWNNDDLMDVLVAQSNGPPALLLKQRGGILVSTNFPLPVPSGSAIAAGDLNNDLRPDLLVAGPQQCEIIFGGLTNRSKFVHALSGLRGIELLDYDNDGWLDIFAFGRGLRVWRNAGAGAFREVTEALRLNALASTAIHSVLAFDADNDGDSDLVLALDTASSGPKLRFFKNDGGNANLQLKIRLVGNRSNSSGLGVKVEAAAGGLRLTRTVTKLPIEIGVAKHPQLDSLTVRWFDLAVPSVDLKVDPKNSVDLAELVLPTGSCPNLYAWDGSTFRFVTDLLGAAPAGLPLSDSRLIEADPDEYVWIGNEQSFPPRKGQFVLQITEELREVLYLDVAKLIVVDHPPGTEVHTTDKMLPAKPFTAGDIITLHQRVPLLSAVRNDGLNATELLAEIDRKLLSPVHLRIPQLRSLAEPFEVTLDFGPLHTNQPLVLALTGWLRFGGGMANVAASHHPDLPFPFPTLQAELPDGTWTPVDVRVGTPAGKTKTIVVELGGKIPPGAQRLRLATAFEIHWDRIALFEKRNSADTRITGISPAAADLHWRGFSPYKDLPPSLPLTPDYDQVYQTPYWRLAVGGWCTRYGPVRELVLDRDDALALINAGDELTLEYPVHSLPEKLAGTQRDFFLFTVGWDKDADFHVVLGWQIEPMPFHGMDDQLYGKQPYPPGYSDAWIKRFNTRWVGPLTLKR